MVIICTFTLPLGVLAVLVFQGYHKDIDFAWRETCGNEYQRPLEVLLELLPQHQGLVARHTGGEKSVQSEITGKAAQIDQAFEALERVDAKLGVTLQFTREGLAKRKREHYRVRTVRQEWQELKTSLPQLKPETCAGQHLHLMADVRTMITHAGDLSNLILDPDLDSYYLMDVTLLALPPILINTYTAVRQVDPDIIDAARGMGMTNREIVRKIELPLATPVVFAGIRIAAVQVVSGAVLAAYIGGGGLGDFITAGIAMMALPQLLVGAIPATMLSIGADRLFGWLQKALTPAGMRAP